MQLFRYLLMIQLVTLTPQLIAKSVPNVGIAFVHGTRDHHLDAHGGYWKASYIQDMVKKLAKPGNHYVVHCDFNRFMWHEEAGDCLAHQLLEFIHTKKITDLTVYTHSHGANVIRWILSNPTYNQDYFELSHRIRQVIAIAPSSGGTILADEVVNGGLLERSTSWLFGSLSDAVKQQRIGEMLIYNQELLLGGTGRPSLLVPFKVVVGTKVFNAPSSLAEHCNGYLLNSGLKITQLYLDSCADGFLNCSSQTYAGKVWFYDKDKTENHQPLTHNQSRDSCFGLDRILISALTQPGETA